MELTEKDIIAYTEAWRVIQCLPPEEKALIPIEIIEILDQWKDLSKGVKVNPLLPMDQQGLSESTLCVLAGIMMQIPHRRMMGESVQRPKKVKKGLDHLVSGKREKWDLAKTVMQPQKGGKRRKLTETRIIAYTEAWRVLQLLGPEEKNLIPVEMMAFLDQHKDLSKGSEIDPELPMVKQAISEGAWCVLAGIILEISRRKEKGQAPQKPVKATDDILAVISDKSKAQQLDEAIMRSLADGGSLELTEEHIIAYTEAWRIVQLMSPEDRALFPSSMMEMLDRHKDLSKGVEVNPRQPLEDQGISTGAWCVLAGMIREIIR